MCGWDPVSPRRGVRVWILFLPGRDLQRYQWSHMDESIFPTVHLSLSLELDNPSAADVATPEIPKFISNIR